MARLQVKYDPNRKQSVYRIEFNPSTYAVEEANTFRDSFEGCLDFIMEQFEERTKLVPHMQPFDLEIEGDLPKRQRKILERVVGLFNRSPKLYQTLADPKFFRNLSEYFGHKLPAKTSSSKK